MKIIRIYLAIVLLTGLLHTSCIKQWFGLTRIKGTVIEEGSGNGIEGVTVNLLAKEGDSWSSMATYKVKETTTNSSGGYELEFDAERGTNYYIEVNKEKYLQTESLYPVEERKKNEINPVMNSTGVLKLHIKNANPYDEQDYISINDYIYVGLPFIITPFYGTSVDTIVKIGAYGNKINVIPYYVEKNGVKQGLSFSIYCTAFDTTFYELNY